MATSSGALCPTWCKLLMICNMEKIKKEALEKILKSIKELCNYDKSEAMAALIMLAGVRDVTYVMLEKGYDLKDESRHYLKELIEKDGN